MDMKNRLTGVQSVVDHHPVAFFFQALSGSHGFGDEKKMTYQFPVGNHYTVNVRYMFLWHNERVNRSLGVDILKGDGIFVLMDKLSGDLFVDDLAEEAGWIERHVSPQR
jgi:hypothetical protein